MIAVVKDRTRLKEVAGQLQEIRTLAESCARQLTAWTASMENSRVHGKRHLTGEMKLWREQADKVREFRTNFLRNLKPDHPLYNSPDARNARGETLENSR